MVACYSKVIAVADCGPGSSRLPGFFKNFMHCIGRNHQSQAFVSIYNYRGWALMDYFNVWPGIEPSIFKKGNVACEACNAVAVNTSKVRRQQHVRSKSGVGRRTAYASEYLLGKIAQPGCRNWQSIHFVVFVNLPEAGWHGCF